MTVQIDSTRFGPQEVSEDQLVSFPRGLIGISGSGYALLDVKPGSVFRWLHSTENPAFALPVVDPFAVIPSFALALDGAERERIGLDDPSGATVYVTVHASPEPEKTTVNLRAPLLIWERRGYQVINTADGADLRAPLVPMASQSSASAPMSAA